MGRNKRALRLTLTCGGCNRTAKAVLLENSQGIYKMHEWLCSDCLVPMDWEVINDIEIKGMTNAAE